MDDERFDDLIQLLAGGATRRGVVRLLAGGLGFTHLAALDADAKKKHHKKKTHRCTTVGDVSITCRKGDVCCDPDKSTGAGCAPKGFPVCCVSDGFAHSSDSVCCDSAAEGAEGSCDTEFPNCCPESIGGCCEDGFPLCCGTPADAYCCPPETTCCDTDPTGCCEITLRTRGGAAATAGRGTWKPRLEAPGNAEAYIAMEGNRS